MFFVFILWVNHIFVQGCINEENLFIMSKTSHLFRKKEADFSISEDFSGSLILMHKRLVNPFRSITYCYMHNELAFSPPEQLLPQCCDAFLQFSFIFKCELNRTKRNIKSFYCIRIYITTRAAQS